MVGDLKLKGTKIRELPTGTVGQLVRASAQQAEVLGLNPSKCQIGRLFRHVLSSVIPWRSIGRSNFNSGLHNLMMLNQKRQKYNYHIKIRTNCGHL